MLIIDDKNVLWILEIKDYRFYRRTKSESPENEFAIKVLDTMAMLFSAAHSADNKEKEIAKSSITCKKIRLVLHFEQSKKTIKLYPRSFDLNDIQLKLRKSLKCIDAHPIVMDMDNFPSVIKWTVS